MLDEIALRDARGSTSNASLFGEHQDIADTSSACKLTVLWRVRAMRSSVRIEPVPFLRARASQVFAAAMCMAARAPVVALGRAVSETLARLLIREEVEEAAARQQPSSIESDSDTHISVTIPC